jgi:hypothetical protein
MRSTRHVVPAIAPEEKLGQYSDAPLLILASLAGGPKHGHAMIEDIVANVEIAAWSGDSVWSDCSFGGL